MTTEEFVHGFVSEARSRAGMLSTWGAIEAAGACEQLAKELETAFRRWWLAELSIADAADESGYSEERLRQMARDGEIPHSKGSGRRGHLRIARCNLPRRPNHPRISSLEERLLRPPSSALRKLT